MELGNHAQIVTREYEEYLKKKLSTFIPLAQDKFPGAQPISFLQEHLQALQQENYFVSEKSDGTRYLLFVHRSSASGQQECFLVCIQLLINAINNIYRLTERIHIISYPLHFHRAVHRYY